MGNSKNNIDGTETDSVGSLAIDGNQIAYIAGMGSPGLPTTDESACAIGCTAGFVVAIDTTKSGSASLVYAVYLPVYPINAMAADAAGDVYLGGVYSPTGIPGLTAQTITFNGYQTTQAANPKAIQSVLLRLNQSGQNIYAASVASGTSDSAYKITAIGADSSGNAYFAGYLNNTTPQVNGLASTASFKGPGPYLAKVDTNNTGSTAASLLYATYLAPDPYYGSMWSLSCNDAGQVAFGGLAGEGTIPPGFSPYTQVNPITEPGLTWPDGTAYPPFVGIVDTTQTGSAALTFLSFPNGVYDPDRIVLGADKNGYPVLNLGGGSQAPASTENPIIFVPGSYATTDGEGAVGTPFFYTISLALLPQAITFTDSLPASATYSVGLSYTISATGGASGNPVTFGASGPATLIGSTLAITGTGTVTITANQAAGGNYAAAAQATQSISISKATQTISFTAPASPLTYGVASITLSATGGASDNAVVFNVVTGPGRISGDKLKITGAGTVVVAANQAGNEDYAAATQVTRSITVFPAQLTVTANGASRSYGAANPVFTANFNGFVNGDAASAITGSPSFTTTAIPRSAPGIYTITVALGSLAAANYTFRFVPGTLTVTKAQLTVSATSVSVPYDQAIPKLAYTVKGFVDGDTSSILKGTPVESTTASKGSNYGNYTIMIKQGTLTANSDYSLQFVNGTLTITPLGTTAKPVFKPGAETSTTALSVTISDSTSRAEIYYTSNGTKPTTLSAKYTAAVRMLATENVQAIAVAPGYTPSGVNSAVYIIATSPAATTKTATGLSTSGATLNGTVIADNATTEYWFAYGTSETVLNSTTTKVPGLTGTTTTPVNAKLAGLKAKTKYYFKVVASNAVGTTSGMVLSFTTN
jgi:hypothetical protein